jgi:hypothetical protein
MICAEFKELAAALALDALDPDERVTARAHLAESITHEGCAEALARAEAAARLLSGALIDTPPSDRVWRSIEAWVSARSPRRRWATAASVAAVILAGRGIRLRSERDAARAQTAAVEALAASSGDLARQCAAQLESARKTSGLAREAIALLQQPGSRVVPFAPQGGFGGAALAVLSPDRRRAILLSTALSPAAARDYQLWVIPPGRGATPVSAGLVEAAEGVALGDFQAGALARGAFALAVSAEPKGGSPTGAPTQVVLVAALGG